MFDDDISDDFLASVSVHPIAQPFARLRPLRSKQHPVRRLVRLCVICFLVLTIVGTTLALAISHISRPVASTPPPPKDKLAYVDKWPSGGALFFDRRSRSYHMFNTAPHLVAVLYTGEDYGDFHLTVRASEIHHTLGNGDYYGVVFRARHDQSRYYLFEISPDDDKYSFLRSDGTESGTSRHNELLPPGVLKSNAPNTLTVDARGNRFTFFVNGVLVAQPVTDESTSPLLKGRIGLCVESQGTEVAFSQLFINE